MRLALYLSRNSPTDFADEPTKICGFVFARIDASADFLDSGIRITSGPQSYPPLVGETAHRISRHSIRRSAVQPFRGTRQARGAAHMRGLGGARGPWPRDRRLSRATSSRNLMQKLGADGWLLIDVLFQEHQRQPVGSGRRTSLAKDPMGTRPQPCMPTTARPQTGLPVGRADRHHPAVHRPRHSIAASPAWSKASFLTTRQCTRSLT